jgi:hypothetical protein
MLDPIGFLRFKKPTLVTWQIGALMPLIRSVVWAQKGLSSSCALARRNPPTTPLYRFHRHVRCVSFTVVTAVIFRM